MKILKVTFFSFLWMFLVIFSAGAEKPVKAPQLLRFEHNLVYDDLDKIVTMGGETEKSAKKVRMLLRPHLVAEEETVLPELGLLRPLVFDDIKDKSVLPQIMKLSEKLKNDYPFMVAAHATILKAVDELQKNAELEKKSEAVWFCVHLKAHIKDEEEIFYPTAILIGKYLALQTSNGSS